MEFSGSSASISSLNSLSSNLEVSKKQNQQILVWNCNGFYNKHEQIKLICKKYNPNILCFQEIRINPGSSLKLRGYSSVFKANSSRQGGVGILIKEGLIYEEILLDSELQAVAIKVEMGKTISIVNVYSSNSSELSLSDLEDLKSQIPRPCIISGDFNAHNPIWDPMHIRDSRGIVVEKFIENHNMILLNTGKYTRMPTVVGHRPSIIDLTFCDAEIGHLISWDTADDTYCSDHFPIILDISLKYDVSVTKKRFNIDKADWGEFRANANLSPFLEEVSNSENFKKIISEINDAAIKTTPICGGKNFKPGVPWWNSEIEIAVKERKKALKKFYRHINKENLIDYKKKNARSIYLIKKSKKESWEQYISKLTPSASSKEIWTKIRRIEGRTRSSQITSLITGDVTLLDSITIANTIGEHFFKSSSNASYSLEFQSKKQVVEQQFNLNPVNNFPELDSDFTLAELQFVMNKVKGKSPGPNGLSYAFFNCLSLVNKEILLHAYNRVWDSGDVPVDWKSSLIIPVAKILRPISANDFRPITLINCDSKLFEKMVNCRLIWALENNNLIGSEQAGFRKGHSTVNNLIILENHLSAALKNRLHSQVVFFDLTKAYDRVWKMIILNQLFEWGIGGKMLNFVYSFLNDRSFKVVNGIQKSHSFKLENGVPQGSSLSVTLFLVAMEAMASVLRKIVGLKFLLYADDLALFASGKVASDVNKVIQKGIDKLFEYAKDNGVTFSPTKTKTLHCCRRHICFTSPLKLGDDVIEEVESHRFLGLLFDKGLTWKNHINDLKFKCMKRLNIIKILGSHNWGAHRVTLLSTIKSIIISKLMYGSQIYGSAGKTYLRKLEPILNQAVRVATRAFVTSPIESLLGEAGFKTIEEHRELLTITTFLKIKENPKSLIYYEFYQNSSFLKNCNPKSFNSRAFDLVCKYDLEHTSLILKSNKLIAPWLFETFHINTDILLKSKKDTSSNEIQQLFLEFVRSHEGYHFIYTDGSKSLDDGCGYSVVSDDISRFKTNDLCSIFSIEAKAILTAVEYAQIAPYSNFMIATDSKSSLHAVKNRSNDEPIINNIRNGILNNTSKNIQLVWVPGHSGVSGNETADFHANLACSEWVNKDDSVSFKDIKTEAKRRWNDNVLARWRSSERNIFSILNFEFPANDANINQLTVKEAAVIARLRIGHTYITHNHRINRTPEPECECGEVLTVLHLLVECELTRTLRSDFNLKGSLDDILGPNADLYHVIKFLHEIDIFNLI